MSRVALILRDRWSVSERDRNGLDRLAQSLERRGLRCEILNLDGGAAPDTANAGPSAAASIKTGRANDLESFDATCGYVCDFLHDAGRTPSDLALIVVVSASPTLVGGVARWLGGTGAQTKPAVVLLFDDGDRQVLASSSLKAGMLVASLRHLVGATRRRPLIAAAHDELASALQDLTGWQCLVHPDHERREGAVSPMPNSAAGMRIALTSNVHDAQSAFAIPEIASELLRHEGIILMMPDWDVARSFVLRRLHEVGRVELTIDERMSPARDNDLAAAILVLPRNVYRARTSARFASFAGSGIPMVVPSDTWMGDRIGCGDAMGITYAHDTTASVVDAASTLIRELDAWRTAASAVAPLWSRREPFERFMDHIVEHGTV